MGEGAGMPVSLPDCKAQNLVLSRTAPSTCSGAGYTGSGYLGLISVSSGGKLPLMDADTSTPRDLCGQCALNTSRAAARCGLWHRDRDWRGCGVGGWWLWGTCHSRRWGLCPFPSEWAGPPAVGCPADSTPWKSCCVTSEDLKGHAASW